MITKDFYIDTHYICGVKTSDNIFDMPKGIFSANNFLQFEEALKKYTAPPWTSRSLWPWLWQTSELTDEVYIYEMNLNRLLYYTKEMKEFFDARLVKKKQTLRGCEIFDIKFKFPHMLSNVDPKVIENRRKDLK